MSFSAYSRLSERVGYIDVGDGCWRRNWSTICHQFECHQNHIFWQNQGGWAFQFTMRRFQWCENLCISKSIYVFQICGSFFVSTCQIQAALSIRWANIILIPFVFYLYILLHMYFHYISVIDLGVNWKKLFTINIPNCHPVCFSCSSSKWTIRKFELRFGWGFSSLSYKSV